jgi:hypothetical protein
MRLALSVTALTAHQRKVAFLALLSFLALC